MQRDSINFATMGIPKMFGKLLIPTLFGMLSTATLIIAEGIFVGHGVGSDGLAAINIACPLFTITAGIGLMFGIGASIVASIHLSKNEIKAAQINITQAFIVSSILMLLISAIIAFFQKEVAYLFGSSEHLLPLVMEYLTWMAPFLVFCMIMNLGLFVIRLDGSPVYAMCCSVIPAVINFILCWLFVMKLDWGVKGAAIATAVGVSIGGFMVMTYVVFFSRKLHLYRLRISQKSLMLTGRNIGYMMKLGSSAFLGEMAISVMVLMGNYAFIRTLGDDGVAAFGVACYCFPLIYMIGNAIAQSAQPIISYNYGAGNWARVRRTTTISVGTAIICGLGAMVVTIVFCKPLVSAFLDPACKAYQIATQGMSYFAVGYVFFAFNMASVGYYQSIEKAKRANIYTLLRGFIFLVICFLFLPKLLNIKGIWLAVPFAEMLTSVIIVGWYFSDKRINR